MTLSFGKGRPDTRAVKFTRIVTLTLVIIDLSVNPHSSQAFQAVAVETSRCQAEVGLLDVNADGADISAFNAALTYREFTAAGQAPARWETSSGRDHGYMMARTLARSFHEIAPDCRLEIFAANPFQNAIAQDRGAPGRGGVHQSMQIYWAGATTALRWMAEHGVRIVVTTMATRDSQQLRDLVNEADRLQLVLVTSAGNGERSVAFPAAYDKTIAVSEDGRHSTLRQFPSSSEWVDFVANGVIPREQGQVRADSGSSYAVARVGATAAYFYSLFPDATQQAFVAMARAYSDIRSYQSQGELLSAYYFDHHKAAGWASNEGRQQYAIASESLRPAAGVGQETALDQSP